MTTSNDNSREGSDDHPVMAPVDFRPQAALPFPVIGIGASAGGVQALEDFFGQVPADPGMAFVVVLHLSPDHTSMLDSIIARATPLPVSVARDGVPVENNHVYVIAPGFTLTMAEGKLHLGEPVMKRGHRRPVDDFLRSLANEQREKSVAVILSGTGTNGSAGAQAIKAAGGLCIAQDPETAAYPGMPRSLMDAGYADQVLEPAKMFTLLQRFVRGPYAGPADATEAQADELQRELAHQREVLAILRTRTRHDFSGYRKPTLLRRIQRRMSLAGLQHLKDYAALLREDSNEVTALANDLMINVTGFFRDAEAWEALRSAVIAPLVSRTEGQPIRAWVTACASGEEPYTLAMLIAEELGEREPVEVKIFATDTADRSLAFARAGIYPAGIEADLTPARLERFFDKEEHTYRVKKEIRDMVVFAPQDILRDPPFSRVDVCTCRNLLIYLEPETQRRVINLLHFSLREGGYLFLGTTETYGGNEHLFEVVNKRWRIYRRIGSGRPRSDLPEFAARFAEPHGRAPEPGTSGLRPSPTTVLQRALLERYGPPTVVVDRTDVVLYLHGGTEKYLQMPAGEPTRDLLQLVRPPLRAAVRSTLRTAMRENRQTVATVTTEQGLPSPLEIVAAPVIEGRAPEYFLVSFRALGPPNDAPAADEPQEAEAPNELRMLRLELQSTTEAYEATTEELKAAHEEATSMNEELQSTNEELETSKEELQSVNEELITVNSQLQAKINQLETTTNDLANLLANTDIAVVFLDAEFRVRRFTPAVADLFDMIDSDIGRPITAFAQKFEDERLMPDAREVLQKLIPLEQEVRSHSGRWYLRRTLPYRTSENRIEGVVVTFIDIVSRKLAEREMIAGRERLQAVIEQLPTAVLITDAPSGRVTYANRRATALFGPVAGANGASGRIPNMVSLAGSGEGGRAHLADDWPLARTVARGETITDEEIEITDAAGERRTLSVSAAPVRDGEGVVVGAVGAFLDITPRKQGERTLREAEARFRLLVESARDFAIFLTDLQGRVTSWNTGAERILGWSEREAIGESGALLFTPEDRAALAPEREMREALQNGRAEDERWHMRKDGSRFWASGVMAPMRDDADRVLGFVKILRDNTERKLAADELVAARAAAEEARRAAEEANRQKDEFIAIVSHELRTPLNTIRLWTRMLRNEQISAKDREDGIQMVERAAIAQQQVIDDLLDVSRIAAGKLRLSLRETRLADAIRGAVSAVSPVAASRGIHLSAEIAQDIGIVRADPGRIQQVLWNLLSNAVKFTPAGGSVRVDARRDAECVVIRVTDSGIGIRPEFLPRVFERFKQAEAGTTRAHGGLGLGLAIAKQLVELHDGRISVESEGEGRGSTFIVKLPLATQQDSDEDTDVRRVGLSDLAGIEILLVEDEAATREAMRRLLEGMNGRVHVVDSVGAARDALAVRRPHVLISDIGLPGEDGYALIRYVRTQPQLRNLPTLALTAFTRPEDRERVLAAGFDAHVPKPVDSDRLISVVANVVRERGGAGGEKSH